VPVSVSIQTKKAPAKISQVLDFTSAEGQNFSRLWRSNAPEAHKLPTGGFSDLISKNSKIL